MGRNLSEGNKPEGDKATARTITTIPGLLAPPSFSSSSSSSGALCGKAVAHDPCGIDFSFGSQEVPCKHAFCRHCLEAELAVSWGCPTCGDNAVWKFETRWKGPCVFHSCLPSMPTVF